MINVLAPDGSISKDHGWPASWAAGSDNEAEFLLGLDRFEAREAVVEWFRKEKLLEESGPIGTAWGIVPQPRADRAVFERSVVCAGDGPALGGAASKRCGGTIPNEPRP